MSNSQAQKQNSKLQQFSTLQNNLKNSNNIPQQIQQWTAAYIDNNYYLTSTSAYQKLQNLQNQIQQQKKIANGVQNKQSEQAQKYRLAEKRQKKQVTNKRDRKDSLQSALSRQCRTQINQIKALKAKFQAQKQLAVQQMKYQNKTLQIRKRRQLKQTTFVIKQHNHSNIKREQKQESYQQKQVSVKKSKKQSIKNFMMAPHQLSGKKSLQKSRQKSRVSQLIQKQSHHDQQQQGNLTKFKQLKRYHQTIQPRKLYHNNKREQKQESNIQNSNTVKKSQIQNINQKHNHNYSKSKQKSFVINRRPPTSNSASKSHRNSSIGKNLKKDIDLDEAGSQQTYSKDQIQKLSTKLRQMQQKLIKVQKRQKQLQLLEKQRQKQRETKRQLQELQSRDQKSNKNSNKFSNFVQIPLTNNVNPNNNTINNIKFKNQQKSNIKFNKQDNNKSNAKINNMPIQSNVIKPDQSLSQQINIQQNSQVIQSSFQETPIKSIKKLRNLKLSNSIIQYNYNEQLVRSKKQYEQSHQKQLMSQQIQQLKKVIRQLQIDKIKQQALMRDLNQKEKIITQKDDNADFQNQPTKRINIDNFIEQNKGGSQKKQKPFRYQIKNHRNIKDKFYVSLGNIQQNLKTAKGNKQQFFSIKQIPQTQAPLQTTPNRITLAKNEPSSIQFISQSSDKPLIKKQPRRFLKVQSKISQLSNLSKQIKNVQQKQKQKQQSISRIKSISSNNQCFVMNSQQIKSRLSGRSSNSYSIQSNKKKSNPQSRDSYRNVVYQNQIQDDKQIRQNKQQTSKIKNIKNQRQKSTKSRQQSIRKNGLIIKQIINKDKLKTLDMKKQQINKSQRKKAQKQLKINSNTLQYSNKAEQIQQLQQQISKQEKQKIHDQQLQKQLQKPIFTIPQIQIPQSFSLPILPSPPTIESTQGQILSQVKKICDILQIKIESRQHPQFKKYRNCVMIRTQGDNRVIVWHYSGKFYIGGWNDQSVGDDRKDGFGIQIIPQKHCYKGNFHEGKRHGQGTIVTMNGNIYKGQWIKGQKNGKGTGYDKTTNAIYMGEWRQGKRHGEGVLKISQKQYYQGLFDKNIKSGFGRELFNNGDFYEGEYRDGSFDGQGKYFWANGSVYSGQFVEGFRDGYGKWKSDIKTGDLYQGDYKKDKKSGKGKYTWFKGCSFEGQFINDLKHGKGRVQYPDGREIKGIWEFGRLKQVQKSNKNSLVQLNDEFVQISPRIQPNMAKVQQIH